MQFAAWLGVMLMIGAGTLARAEGTEIVTQGLNRDWQYRQAKAAQAVETGWMPAVVPGDIHLDLMRSGRLEDPFYRKNEEQAQWVEKAAWEYRVDFEAAPSLLARLNVNLVFEGLDGACEVWLNGVRVLDAGNAFRTWRVDVKKQLHKGTNHLWILFYAPMTAAARVASGDPWQAKTKTEVKTYIRKPAYEFGWDWGPRLVTSGLWKPVRLEGWDKLRVADFTVRQPDVHPSVARVVAEAEVESAFTGPAKVTVQYEDNGKPVTVEMATSLHPGWNTIAVPVTLRNPKLWYPAGYGEQALTSFGVEVSGGGSADRRELRTGLRSVELRREADKDGRSFVLVVNGIPVFAKGANVIPFDSLPSRVTAERQRQVLESARDANMNMVRLWGGGYYESDDFYALCDELGLMVWQDFMFGNDWQPGTAAFKQNIEAEAEDQVRRLRNHPSLVLWCGNNETEIAFNWGDRWRLPADVKLRMWQDYLTVFSGILPRVVVRLQPELPYWPSSPSADYDTVNDKFQSGDTHDWSVWHSRVPFTGYEKRRWRFVTEFGFQSFPEQRSVESFTAPEDRTGIDSAVMLAHQKNKDGNAIIQDYLLKDYPQPKDFSSFLYVSQILQAEGIKVGAEHFRRSRPLTMGALFWQLNDCWPVASWSSIDYYGRWKALQYYARRFFAPVLVSPHMEEGTVKVYLVSDRVQPVVATLRVRLMDFAGKTLLDESSEVRVKPASSEVALSWPLKKIAGSGATDLGGVFVVAELAAGGEQLSRNLTYLTAIKNVRLKEAALKVETAAGSGASYKLRVSSPVLARSVFLSFGDLDVKPSDNFFDVLPGETVEVAVSGKASLEELKRKLKAISLTDAFAVAPQRATMGPAK